MDEKDGKLNDEAVEVEAQEQALAPVNVDKVALFVSEPVAAQRFLEAVGQFRKMVPHATKPTDWVSFGDPAEPAKCQVYLQEYAASQISRLLQTKFGYNIVINKPVHLVYPDSPVPWGIEKVVDGVAHTEVIVQGSVDITDVSTGKTERIEPIIGSANTMDPFVGKKYGEKLDPMSVPFGLLLKKAIANYKGNCYREIWGLRGFTLQDLKDCGLNISLVHDSQRRAAGGTQTQEEKDEKAKLWDRILRAHDGKSEEARKFLKSMTGYPAHPQGKYKAKEGFDNIAQLYLKDKDGVNDSIAHRKIKEALDKMEKDHGADADGQAAAGQAAETAQQAYMRLKGELEACKTPDQVMTVEKKIAALRNLSASQMKALESIASSKVDALTAETGGL